MVITREESTHSKFEQRGDPKVSETEDESSSGGYRSLIGLSKNRLKKILQDTANIKLNFSEIADSIEKVSAMRDAIRSLETYITKINAETSRLEKYNSSWMTLQAGYSDKSLREEDVKVYKATATGPNGFITMLDDAYATVSDLELRKIEVQAVIDQEMSRLQTATVPQTQPALQHLPATQMPPSAQSFMYRVPQLEVCKFDGEILKYRGWKERMRTAILERNDLPDDVKIQLTIDRLEGKAAKWVQGIKIEGRNLQLIWSILDEHGGDDSHYKIALHKELQGLSCHNEHVAAARAFYDELESILRQLEYIGESVENNYLYECIMAKLPRWILNDVLNSHYNGKVKDLRKKIHELIMKREEVDRYRALYQASGRVNDNKSKDKPTKEVAAAVTTNSNSLQKQSGKENKSKKTYKKRDPYCILCEEKGHWASQCTVHKSSKGAYEKIVANKRCTKCTRKGHNARECPKPATCSLCKKTGHRDLTCRLRDQASNRSTVAAVIEQNAASVTSVVASVTSTVAAASNDKTEILLLSSEVTIANPVNRKEAPAFAFLDPGSQSSFIADHVANKLQLQPVRTRTIEFDNPVSQAKTMRVKEYEIELLLEDGSWYAVKVLGIPKILDTIRSAKIDLPNRSNQEVSITKGPMKAPEILLGTEPYGELTNQPKHEATGFRMVKTKLGTLLSGSGTFVNREVVAAMATNEDKDLNKLMDRFQSLELIGIKDDPQTNDDEVAEEYFRENIRKENDRYIVRFLWKNNKSLLKTNAQQAYNRLVSVWKMLSKDPEALEIYHKELVADPLQRGTIEEVPNDDGTGYYMPHHAVVRADKLTTPSRPVFDASSSSTKGDLSSDTLSISTPADHRIQPKGRKAKRRYDHLPERATRRMVLAFIGAIFDPLGLLSPAILPCKQFLHKLTEAGRAWDEMLSPDEDHEWTQLAKSIIGHTMKIPRLVVQTQIESDYELHVFCDASKDAFATAIYLRQTATSRTGIIFAKSRIKPVKKITIPRMELLGIVLGGRSTIFVKKHIRLQINRTILWTDSRCVLAWILSPDIVKLRVFENNRIREIRSYPIDEYRYVPTSSNPSDLGTRGSTLAELNQNRLWKDGPEWLGQSEEQWPPKPDNQFDYREWLPSPEEPEFEITAAVKTEGENEEPIFNTTRFRTFERLLLVIAYVCRFILTLKSRKNGITRRTGPIIASEIFEAEILAIKDSQRCHPPTILEEQNLGIHADENGILRCYGRLERSQLEPDAKTPIFVSRSSHLANLIMDRVHRKQSHSGGVQHLVAGLRERFWIPKASQLARKTLSKCIQCRRQKAKPFKLPQMAPLPTERSNQVTPFAHSGVDYFGPYTIKDNCENTKIWGCLFVCFVTRAIHVEAVYDLSAMAFINAFRRFISRRSRPKILWSDNGTNFKAGSNAIKLAWQNLLVEASKNQYFATEGITWKFIPELSPFFGGAYERLVGLTKNALQHAIGRRKLKRTDFETFLIEAEAIVNSRPLTYVHNDFSSNEIVRPIDFIAPNALLGTPPISENPEDPNYLPKTAERREVLIEIWKETTKSIDRFWKMWYEHYLKALREHQKVTHRSPRSTNPRTPRIGEVVIIHEENAPRGTWDLGRVTELVKSSDSYIRVAKVRKANGHVLTRAINLLYPLEVSDDPRETDEQETKPAETAVPIKLQEKPVTRTQARKLTTSLTFATIALLFILPTIVGLTCPKGHALYWEDYTPCTEHGIEIWSISPNGDYCWTKDPKSKERLKACVCPSWAEGCSFYAKYDYGIATKNSTFKAPWVAKALQSAKPAIYSFKLNPSCDPTPIPRNVIVVQLYDETMHYVNKLNLVWQDRWEDEFYCLGRGQRITGSPHYCDNHPCEDFGDRFCFYKQPPIAVMIIGEARIPIKAWGHVNLTTYNRKREIQTSCYSCDAKCHTEGISLIFDNGTQLIEIKSNGFEDQLELPQSNQTFRLPPQIISIDYETQILFWMNGHKTTAVTIHCKAKDFCLNLNCTICFFESLANHNCLKRTAIIALGVTAAILFVPTLIVLCLLCKIVILLLKVMKWILEALLYLLRCFTCLRRRKPTAATIRLIDLMEEDNQPLLPIHTEPPNHKQPLIRVAPLIAIILLIICSWPGAQACAHTETFTAQAKQCFQRSTTRNCRFEETTLLDVLPRGQDICLLLNDPDGRPAGHVTLTAIEYELVCEPQISHWTREFYLDSVSVKRCDGRGSCEGETCDNLPYNATIPELGTKPNSQLGFTRCDRSCGGWACWCGWWTPACLFSRLFAVPVTPKPYCITSCAQLTGRLSFSISIEQNGTARTEEFKLSLGKTETWNNMQVTLTGFSTPPLTIPNPHFISDGSRKAYLTEETLAKTKKLSCYSESDALKMNCSFSPAICQVIPGKEITHYQCEDTIILESLLNDPSTMLPKVVKHEGTSLFFAQENDEVVIKPLEVVAHLKLTINGLHLTTTADLNSIQVTIIELRGCYSCRSGAQLTFKCQTDFGSAMAHVKCPSKIQFPIMCNSTATVQTARVYTTKAYINEECNVSTVTYTTNMRLKGHLQYAPSERTNGSALMDITGPLQTGKAGIDWPDFLELITGKWVNTLLFIGSIAGTILLGVIIIKIACCFSTFWLCRTRYPKPKNN